MSELKTYTDEDENTYVDILSYQWLEQENTRLREALDALSKDYISLNKKINKLVVDLDEALFCMRKSLFINSYGMLERIKNNILNED